MEKNYFIPLGSSEDRRMKEVLDRHDILYGEMKEEVEGRTVEGLAIDHEYMLKALMALGAKVVNELEMESVPGMFTVRLEFGVPSEIPADQRFPTPVAPSRETARAKEPPRLPEVTIESWEGCGRSEFVSVIRKHLLPALGKDIVLNVPHGDTTKPRQDGRFWMHIWSSPSGSRKTNPPEKIWGIEVDCRDKGFQCTGGLFFSRKGIPIKDPETGWDVAELIGDNLYIHHDLCEEGTDRERQILAKIIDEVIMLLSLSDAEIKTRIEEFEKKEREAGRLRYIKACSGRLKKTLEGTQKSVVEHERQIQKLTNDHIKAIQELNGLRLKLQNLLTREGDELEKYGLEFDELLKVPGVTGVEITPEGVVMIFTDHVFITPEGREETYDIGCFRIEIDPEAHRRDRSPVRMFNLTRQGAGGDFNTNHPHVKKNGTPCFGNIGPMIPELIGNFEFSALAQILIEYLHTVNLADSAGEKITRCWPVVEKGQLRGKRGGVA